MNPFDYSLCDETVTVYRYREGQIHRQVLENCRLVGSAGITLDTRGRGRYKRFWLLIPGDIPPLKPGDRVCAGVGPGEVEWETFLPALVEPVYEMSYVKPCFWEGQLVHWEAGHR